MKKVKCATFNPDGSLKQAQREVEMHPLERAAYMKYHELQNELTGLGEPMSKEEEHDLLVEEGLEAVRAKRDEFKAKEASVKPKMDSIKSQLEAAQAKWDAHSERCIKHGVDRDTFDGDATVKLAP